MVELRQSLSFKKTEKEQEIYQHLKEQLSPSNYVKELIWEDMQKNKKQNTKKETETNKNMLNNLF